MMDCRPAKLRRLIVASYDPAERAKKRKGKEELKFS